MAIAARKLITSVTIEGEKVVLAKLKEIDAAVDKNGKTGSSAFAAMKSSIGGVVGVATAAVGAVAAIGGAVAAGAGALFQLAKSASDSGSEIQDMIEKTGVGAETLSALRYAVSTTNASFEDLGGGITKFSKTVGEAARGSEEAKAKLIRLGIDPQAAVNDLEGALSKAFKTINNAPAGVKQTTAAIDAVGKSGANLIGVVKAADGNIAGLIKRGKELGVVMSNEDARAADEFGDTLATLESQAKATGFLFAKEFMPEITGAMQDISRSMGNNKDAATRWGEGVANAIRGIRVTIQNDGDEILSWLRIAAAVATLGMSELTAYLGGSIGEYINRKGKESRANDVSPNDLYDPSNRVRHTNSPAPATPPSTPPPATDTYDFSRRTGGVRGAKEESPLEKATKDLLTRNSALELSIALLKKENELRLEGRKLTDADRLAVELQVKGYQKLATAETEATIALQRKRDALAANLQAAQVLDDFWKEYRRNLANNVGLTNQFTRAYDDLVKKMGLRPTAAMENEILAAIGEGALSAELARQNEALDQINGKTETYLAAWDRIVQEATLALVPLDESTIYWGRINALVVDSAIHAKKFRELLENLPEALPQGPTSTGGEQSFEEWLNADGGAMYKQIFGDGPPAKPIDQWKAAFSELKDIGVSAMHSLADAIGSVIENWVLMGSAGDTSAAKVTATILGMIAKQAAVMAIMETAYGIAALTPWGAAQYGPAAFHFKSAALFAAVAAGAAVAGRAVAGDKFNGKGEGAAAAPDYSQFGQQGYAGNQSIRPNVNQPLPPSGRDANSEALARAVQQLHDKIDGFSEGAVLGRAISQRRGLITDTVNRELGQSTTRQNEMSRRLQLA